MDKRQAALMYASWGWAVIPVVENSKTPATIHGVHDATTDPFRINTWWDQNPEYNIGIAAGEKSGIIVYDIDPRNGGDITWPDFIEEYGGDHLFDAPMQITGGRGSHWIAKYTNQVKSCKLLEGVDVLSDGRYFIAYPSVVNGNAYEWEADSDPQSGDVAPFEIPPKWVAFSNAVRGNLSDSVKSGGDLIDGSRNHSLTSLGGYLRSGGMGEQEILAALLATNDLRCHPPLSEKEVERIAKSVSRYTADSDILRDRSLGEQVAQAFINERNAINGDTDFYLTSAIHFIQQPSPMPYIISKWIPQGGMGTLFGPPGIGKSFLAVDIALSIATGRDWCGNPIKQPGRVIYLAGEGNYGLRSRVASWCQMNNLYQGVENLFISNKSINLDNPENHKKALDAVSDISKDRDFSLIIVDTLNRHIGGDENKATDMGLFLDSCSIIANNTGATVLLVHHSGHGDGAEKRERGSSALRGAMDFAIRAFEHKDGLKVNCEKMKDGPKPPAFYGRITDANLGWVDEFGEVSNGAFFHFDLDLNKKMVDKQKSDDLGAESDDKEAKIKRFYHHFFQAWIHTGKEVIGGMPFVNKQALKNCLMLWVSSNSHEYFDSESKALQSLKQSDKRYMVGLLVENGIIEVRQTGYLVKNFPEIYDQWAAQKMLK